MPIEPFSDRFDLICTHGYCPDGTASAWAILNKSKKLKPDNIVYLRYGKDLEFPDVSGKRVIMVDFAPSREEAIKLHEQAEEFIILDHHKSHETELEGLDFAYFDMTRAGCQLAWDYVTNTLEEPNDNARPWFLNYIADRDLWTYKMPDSKAVTAAISMKRLVSFDNMDRMNAESEEQAKFTLEALKLSGNAILEYKEWLLKGLKRNSQIMNFNCANGTTYRIVLIECNCLLVSDIGNYLAEDKELNPDFVIVFRYDIEKQMTYLSARASQDSEIDLGQICKAHGGGGHPKASGFEIEGQDIINYGIDGKHLFEKIEI